MPLLIACGSSHGLGDDGGGGLSDGGRRTTDAGNFDAGAARDAGPRADGGGGPRGTCDADDASEELCPEFLCDGPPSWHWDGERCFAADCGTCVGADCDLGVSTRNECEVAHVSCEASLCNATDGTWQWWAELCGHHSCGAPAPEVCEVGAPGCDCGVGRSFVPGVGCEVDPECPIVEPSARDTLCTSTGGSWDTICCDSECGELCDAECLEPACDCGPMRVFHSVRGCEVGARCMERLVGESCEGDARCQQGTICCDSCGGPGCAGEPTCRTPVCDTSPTRDSCGNNPTAP